MLPLILKTASTPICLIGYGEKLELRRTMLMNSGAVLDVFAAKEQWPDPNTIAKYRILYVAGTTNEEAAPYAHAARKAGVLLNVEDVIEWCDFYVPAIVRRGDLLVTISTSGKASGVSKILREHLEKVFPLQWGGYLDDLAALRQDLKSKGASMAEVMQGLRAHIAGKGWL